MFEIDFWGLNLVIEDASYEKGYAGSFDEPPEPPSVEFSVTGNYHQDILDFVSEQDELYDMVLAHFE